MQKIQFKPLLFSSNMVQAILNGHKTETRRIIDFTTTFVPNDYSWDWTYLQQTYPNFASPIQVGNIIWVRETFAKVGQRLFYKADNNNFENAGLKGMYNFNWTPSLHMPKNICRLFLQTTSVQPQKLHDITANSALAEGVATIEDYKKLWIKLNGLQSWQNNPWVWVYKFTPIPYAPQQNPTIKTFLNQL